MRLCITSTGKDLSAKVDPRFGRAPYFLIIETENNAVEVVRNSYADEVQGAGTGAVSLVMEHKADQVLTGRLGPNALNAFQNSGVKVMEGLSSEYTVQEALEQFKTGTSPAGEASAPMPGGAGTGGRGGGRGMGGGGRGTGGGRGMGGGRRNR